MQKSNTRRRMRRILQEVRDKYNVHGRAFTARDFYRICKAEAITLADKNFIPRDKWPLVRDVPVAGWIMTTPKGKCIFLRGFFDGDFRLEVAMHELGHHFLGHNGYSSAFASGHYDRRSDPNEVEADLFAELATESKIRRTK